MSVDIVNFVGVAFLVLKRRRLWHYFLIDPIDDRTVYFLAMGVKLATMLFFG